MQIKQDDNLDLESISNKCEKIIINSKNEIKNYWGVKLPYILNLKEKLKK